MANTLLELESVQISRIGTRVTGSTFHGQKTAKRFVEIVDSYWSHFQNLPMNNTLRINNYKKIFTDP